MFLQYNNADEQCCLSFCAVFASLTIAALPAPDIASPFALIGAEGTGCAAHLSHALLCNRLESTVGGESCGKVPVYDGAGAQGANSPIML